MIAKMHYESTQLEQYLASSPRVQDEQMQLHLESCPTCQSKLETIAESDFDWQEASELIQGSSDTQPRFLENASEGQPSFLESSDAPDSIGRFGRYEIREILGRGGMGIVLRAFDPSLGRQCAIKVLAPVWANSAAARQRFSREARNAAAVVHPHVVPIQTVEEQDGLPYLVMPVVEGQSLQQRVQRDGPLDIQHAVRIAVQVAEGLAAAHEQGLVHRDIKPANVLLENGVERVQITDFGLARTVDDASMTRSGVIAGTPQYMSPEQAHGDAVDHRSDLFSLGSVMYFMLTGHSPFRAETTMGVLHRIVQDAPRPLRSIHADVPHWFEAIVEKLLSKAAQDRYESAAEVAALLKQCQAYLQSPHAVPPPNVPRVCMEPRSDPGVTARVVRFIRGRLPRRVLAGSVGLAMLSIFGVLMFIDVGSGTLRIETNGGEQVPIRITRNNKTVERLVVSQTETEIELKSGPYVVAIDGDATRWTIAGSEVHIERGDTHVATITEVRHQTSPKSLGTTRENDGINGNAVRIQESLKNRLQGEWMVRNREDAMGADNATIRVVNDLCVWTSNEGEVIRYLISIDESVFPRRIGIREIDPDVSHATLEGIIRSHGEHFQICLPQSDDDPLPKSFVNGESSSVFVLRRPIAASEREDLDEELQDFEKTNVHTIRRFREVAVVEVEAATLRLGRSLDRGCRIYSSAVGPGSEAVVVSSHGDGSLARIMQTDAEKPFVAGQKAYAEFWVTARLGPGSDVQSVAPAVYPESAGEPTSETVEDIPFAIELTGDKTLRYRKANLTGGWSDSEDKSLPVTIPITATGPPQEFRLSTKDDTEVQGTVVSLRRDGLTWMPFPGPFDRSQLRFSVTQSSIRRAAAGHRIMTVLYLERNRDGLVGMMSGTVTDSMEMIDQANRRGEALVALTLGPLSGKLPPLLEGQTNPNGLEAFLNRCPQRGAGVIRTGAFNQPNEDLLAICKAKGVQMIDMNLALSDPVFVLVKDRLPMDTLAGPVTKRRFREFIESATDMLTPASVGLDPRVVVRIDCYINEPVGLPGSRRGKPFSIAGIVTRADREHAEILASRSIADYLRSGYQCIANVCQSNGDWHRYPVGVLFDDEVRVSDNAHELDSGLAVYEMDLDVPIPSAQVVDANEQVRQGERILVAWLSGFQKTPVINAHRPDPLGSYHPIIRWKTKSVLATDNATYGEDPNGFPMFDVEYRADDTQSWIAFNSTGRVVGFGSLLDTDSDPPTMHLLGSAAITSTLEAARASHHAVK